MSFRSKISKVCSTAFLASTLVLSAGVPAFAAAKDVAGHWAEVQINKWIDKGYIAGYADNTFKPNKSITRAEFMTLVNKSFGFTDTASVDYKDVSAGQWFYTEVAKAKAAGYISGYEDGTMRPNNPITRQEAAVIIEKLLKLDVEDAASKVAKFADASAIAAWSKNAVGEVVAKGIMSGYPDATFKPKNNITRAESVFTLEKALGLGTPGEVSNANKFDKAGTYGPEKGETKTIEGNVVISASDVKLQNTVITGDLVIDEAVGQGTVRLSNVTVKGTTTIKGGGPNSIYAEDSTFGKVVVNKKQGDVHIVASGTTTASSVTLQSGAKLEQGKLTGSAKGFSNVTIAAIDGTAKLVGNFATVTVEGKASVELSEGTVESLEVAKGAKGATINVLSGATVKTLTANDEARVNGSGKVENAKVNVNGVYFETKPTNVQTAAGVTISTGNVGGGGGSSSSSSSSNSDTLYLNGGSIPATLPYYVNKIIVSGGEVTLPANGTVSVPVEVTGDATLKGSNSTINNTLTMKASKNIVLDGVTVTGQTILN